MATDLLAMMSSTLGTQLVDRAGSFLGASESSMQGAVGAALPALLGGVMQKASTPSGAAELMKLLNTPGLDAGIVGNLGSYLGGGEKTSSLLSMGSGLLSSLFGDKLGNLINTIASSFGLKSASASNLMALAAPMVLGFLKTQVSENRLDAKGLASLLASQAEFLKPRLDSRITSALGFASPMAFVSSLAGAAGRAADAAGAAVGRAADRAGAAAGRAYDTAGAYGTAAASAAGSAAAATRPVFLRWLPWIILGAIALILLPQLQHCGEQATKKVGDTVGDAAKATSQAAKDAARATADAAKAGDDGGDQGHQELRAAERRQDRCHRRRLRGAADRVPQQQGRGARHRASASTRCYFDTGSATHPARVHEAARARCRGAEGVPAGRDPRRGAHRQHR